MNASTTWELGGPLNDRTSLHAHVLALDAATGFGPFPDGGEPLPDEEPVTRGGLRFAPGALDGVIGHHMASGSNDATPLLDLLSELVASEQPRPLLPALYNRLVDQSLVEVIDGFYDALAERRDLPRDRLATLGRWLARHGTHRAPVKLGLVLVGHAGEPTDSDLLVLLGRLEELTRFAAAALTDLLADPEPELFTLAQQVSGWGRIHAVELLAGSTDPRVIDWLVRGGYRNSVMDEYTAYTVAMAADLPALLSRSDVDDALMDSLAGLLTALATTDGPARDLRDYAQAPHVVARYLELVHSGRPSLARLEVANALQRFVAHHAGDWNEADRSRVRLFHQDIARAPETAMLVRQGLDASDAEDFGRAAAVAKELGLPYTAQVQRRLATDPTDGYLWQLLIDDAPAAQAVEAFATAETLLPLDELLSPPSLELMGDPAEHALDLLVSRLGDYPGHGCALIRTALRNRICRTRWMAVKALTAWPHEHVPVDIRAILAEACRREIHTGLKDDMRVALERL